MSTCSDAFFELARKLDFADCAHLQPIVYWNQHLQHPTMRVVEALLIGGAVAYLWRAVGRARARQSGQLILLASALTYMLTLEIPAYFLDKLGMPDLAFVHNKFTIGFLFERMPLYIIALYLSLLPLAFTIVERLGIFERRNGVLIGSVCVGFVHHAFYEIFDHYGPQYHWWVWNYDAGYQQLRLDSVPIDSLVGFSMLGPFAFALCVRKLGGENTVGRALLAGVASTAQLGMLISVIAGLSVLSGWGTAYHVVAEVICFGIVAAFGLLTVRALQSAPLNRIPIRSLEGVYSIVYLAVFAALWVFALVDRPGADNGCAPYVVGCYGFLGYLMWRCFARSSDAVRGELGDQDRRNPASQVSA